MAAYLKQRGASYFLFGTWDSVDTVTPHRLTIRNLGIEDIITHPRDTPLLRAAAARGLRTHDGLEMLVGQAREAFRRFYGAEPPKERDAELRALLIK